MKYLIVGGHGFIGSHFCKQLAREDYLIYDVGTPNGDPAPEVVLARRKGLPHTTDPQELTKYVFDYVIHFGAHAGVRSGMDMEEYLTNNVIDLHAMIKMLRYKKFIYISSSSVLGDVETNYSLSKKCAERVVSDLVNHLIIRPFTVYGPHGRPEMFITKAAGKKPMTVYGDPEKIKRRFTYVLDVVEHILENKDERGIINLPGKYEYSLKQVLDLFNKTNYVIGPADSRDFNEQHLNTGKSIVCTTRMEDVINEI